MLDEIGGSVVKIKNYDIVVIGASLGGVMAAYSAAKQGKKVVLTEETDWIGGQLTSQAVPPDEHSWIEKFGCTSTYRNYRKKVRDFYRKNYPLIDEIRESEIFDPGNSSVSRIAHEPRIALHLLNEMMLPYVCKGNLEILLNCKPVSANVEANIIKSITIKNLCSGIQTELTGKYFIDGTDIGELLPLTGAEYVTGAESKEMTGEPNALDIYEPRDMQPITWVAAVDYVEGEDFTIERPKQYDFWKNLMQPYDNYPVLSWYGPDSVTGKAKKFSMFEDENEKLFPLWSYRRIVYPGYYKDKFHENDITLINWPQNDYFLGNVFEDKDVEKHIEGARQLTLCFIYWLQTEAPRTDGGKGYKGIRLRPDVLGTEDGLAKYPYIRESRRIKAEYTVVEGNINASLRDNPQTFKDTVGVGSYHIDLHITTATNTFKFDRSWPFEIPLGALIPVKIKNLIPGCKNIGTTHLTNGCFRLHPVEWNIGEVAGYLASQAIDKARTPSQIRNDDNMLVEFQQKLVDNGIELHWPENEIYVI